MPSEPTGNPYGYGATTTDPSTYYGASENDPFMLMDSPIQTGPSMLPIDTARILHAESCEDWTRAGVSSPTVSVARLAVPGKASGQFQKACGSFKDRRFDRAEDQARRAITIYPEYGPAWVLLGEILSAEHKDDEGRSACDHAKNVDPNYSPSYVCLADFASRAKDWKQVSTLSDYALSLDPVGNMYALMYSAQADLHLQKIDEAETNAESAEKLDRWRKAPEIHLLLAQIYEAKGDRPQEISQLRQYLKIDPHAPDAAVAKATLAQVEKPPAR
jgi:tetratricopeptide (TPR) repeat protein